jgi:hypothetical protein
MKLGLACTFVEYAVTATLAVPVGAIMWFEILYFGLTANVPSIALWFLGALVAFAVSFALPLIRSQRPAEILRYACALGLMVSLPLPLLARTTFFLIESALTPQHKMLLRGIGEGGLIFSNILVFFFAVGVGLALVFWLCYDVTRKPLETKASCQHSGA